MSESLGTILLIEDESDIRRFLRVSLVGEGFKLIEAATGRRGTIDAASHKPDMAIVDLALPDIDGVEVIHSIREWSSMPIIILSARSQEVLKVQALDAGADDYVTKPFGIGELLARIRVAMRHAARGASAKHMLGLSDGEMDLVARTIVRGGRGIHLTPIEFRLVMRLARSLGMVVTHRQLLSDVWGPTHIEHTHYLRIYMKQLRDKLEKDPLRPQHFLTETGVGYRLVAPEISNRRQEQ